MFSGGRDSLATTILTTSLLEGRDDWVAHINTGIGIPETSSGPRLAQVVDECAHVRVQRRAAGLQGLHAKADGEVRFPDARQGLKTVAILGEGGVRRRGRRLRAIRIVVGGGELDVAHQSSGDEIALP
jgi:hypothetical protein